MWNWQATYGAFKATVEPTQMCGPVMCLNYFLMTPSLAQKKSRIRLFYKKQYLMIGISVICRQQKAYESHPTLFWKQQPELALFIPRNLTSVGKDADREELKLKWSGGWTEDVWLLGKWHLCEEELCWSSDTLDFIQPASLSLTLSGS